MEQAEQAYVDQLVEYIFAHGTCSLAQIGKNVRRPTGVRRTLKIILQAAHYLQGVAARTNATPAPYLCVDTWLGDVGMALGHYLHKFVSKQHGQPTLYHQFLVNMISANLTRVVLPFVVPSFIGARSLEHLRLLADFIYLDSAHEQGETFIELGLYWRCLSPGGILAGDDLNWQAVGHDVRLFARVHGLKVSSFNDCHHYWVHETRPGTTEDHDRPHHAPGSACVWYLRKPE